MARVLSGLRVSRVSIVPGSDLSQPLEAVLGGLPTSLREDELLMFRAALLLAELCGNVGRHGHAEHLCVGVQAGIGRLVLTVVDDGEPFDMTRGGQLPDDVYAESGRGLFLIRELASGLAYRRFRGRNIHRVAVAS